MNSLSINLSKAVAHAATALFFIGAAFTGSPDAYAAKKRPSTDPDFAYPKTVVRNADKALSSSLSSDNWSGAAVAMIQKVTAANMVSRDSVEYNIACLDSIANIAPAAWKPAFLLIEADIYNSVYNSIRWKADSRRIAADSLPANPYEWSRDMFADKVFHLSGKALQSRENDSRPLKTWSSLLANADMAYKYGMTIDEFICWKCASSLAPYADMAQDVIPFFPADADNSTPGQRCRTMREEALDALIDKTAARGQSMLEARAISEKASSMPESLRGRFLIAALEKLKGSEGAQIILQQLESAVIPDDEASDTEFRLSSRRYVDLLRESIKEHPNGLYANALKNILANCTTPTANIQYKSQYLSSSDIRMDIELTNCPDTWILVYDYSKYLNSKEPPSNKTMAATSRLIKAAKVSASGNADSKAKAVAEIGRLPVGNYAVVPSATADHRGIYTSIANQKWRQTFTVSDISVLTLNNLDSTTRVVVVDGRNGRPIQDATVKVYTRRNYSAPKVLAKTLITDADGSVSVTERNFTVEALYNGSKWTSDMRLYNSMQHPDTATHHHVAILPDRGIYHPGDSISAVFVAYTSKGSEMTIDTEREYTIQLLNANGKKVDSMTAVSDCFGRATVNFLIPEEGLLGRWSLSATEKDGRSYGNASLQVADYVAPTFFISSDNEKNEVAAGDVVKLKGQVLTYSGMPLAGATVNYTVSYRPPMRWYAHSYATYDASVIADADGKYTITLPTANLKGTYFERGVFSVAISATSPAGETQSGPVERFALGREYSIQPVIPSGIEISDSIPALNFKVTDMLGEMVNKTLRYNLVNKATGKTVAEGTFMSPSLRLPDANYTSAEYGVRVSLADDRKVTADASVVLWRKTDKTAPAGVELWIPQTTFRQTPGDSHANVVIGSGIADRWIPAVISEGDSAMEFKWLHVESDNLILPLPYPTGSGHASINVCYMSDLDTQSETIRLYPVQASDNLTVATESFRDKVTAGDAEHWKFRFNRKYSAVGKIPVMAVMTDAALNHIAPFSWNLNPARADRSSFASFRLYRNNPVNMYFQLKTYKYLSYRSLYFPDINDYGCNWGIGYMSDGIVYATGAVNEVLSCVQTTSRSIGMSRKMAASANMAEVEMTDECSEEEPSADLAAPKAGAESGENGNAGNSDNNARDLRESEFPVAFFMPYLTTGADGMVDIDFTVPNFNTTWSLQVLGYDKSMQVAATQLQTVASKPVMVSTHAPRFVRTGDVIQLTATVFNNTGDDCSLKGRIQLVDLLSGRVIATREYPAENVKALGNRLLSMSWTVPSDVSSVGFRAYAETDSHRDGEQALVPVLPASSPIVESTPFWLAPDKGVFEIKLPKFKDSDQVTLQYCDNPAWYCLTALPDIMQTDSKSVTSKMTTLYGNAMAYDLISSDASLKKGLEMLLSDKDSQFAALKSNLEKDGNLKIAKLSNTPWVNSAESETLRMNRLSTLLDSDVAEKTITTQLEELSKLQTGEGGWSWCPDMEPSPYITRSILSQFASLTSAGALDDFPASQPMVKAAIRFVDEETWKEYTKYHKKDESLAWLLDWLYVRSSFDKGLLPTGGAAHNLGQVYSRAEKDIAKEWKDMCLRDKAIAAMLLWRAGNRKTALEILESLSQFASESPEKGIWFDNLSSSYGNASTLQTTTAVLRAFAEIQPTDKIIDGLRQWLVLSRQVQDWGKQRATVETIDAILRSGSDWTSRSDIRLPEFQLRAKPVRIPESAALTGAFTVTLDARQASGKKLKISRSNTSPAWGGVISQYEAPLDEVKAAEIPNLSIRKETVALVDAGNGSLVPKQGIRLKKGMKVRVTLTITNDRAMDYMALTDERSACLEPTDQLSSYTSTDGVWYYKEVRDSQTNLYIEYLPKGHHVISYDCTVAQDGTFSCGIATIQSQYSPLITAHSAASVLTSEQ